MWFTFGKLALKVAIYALGHRKAIAHAIEDAKEKDVEGLLDDIAEFLK